MFRVLSIPTFSLRSRSPMAGDVGIKNRIVRVQVAPGPRPSGEMADTWDLKSQRLLACVGSSPTSDTRFAVIAQLDRASAYGAEG